MRSTALRILPARSPISAGLTASLILSRRRAWPSMIVSGVRNSCDAIDTKLRCSRASRCSFANCSSSSAAWRASMSWLRISSIALLRNTTVACAISPISSRRSVSGISIVGIVGGKAAHAVGKVEQRRGNGAADVDERRDHQHGGDHDGEEDEPERMAIGDGEPIARDLGAGDGLVGELAERIARRVIGGARRAAVDLQRLVLAVAARQHQHLVDDAAIVVPVRLELIVEIVFRRIVTNALELALGIGDGAVEVRHLLFVGGGLGRIGGQQRAALEGAEVRGIIVEIAERARRRQPDFGDIGGQQIEIRQPPDAERAEHDDQRKEQQEHRGEVEADRLRLPHENVRRRSQGTVPGHSPTITIAQAATTGNRIEVNCLRSADGLDSGAIHASFPAVR